MKNLTTDQQLAVYQLALRKALTGRAEPTKLEMKFVEDALAELGLNKKPEPPPSKMPVDFIASDA